MEIQNSLRSTLMADEGMWTPEKIVATWKNTFSFQTRKQMHFFGFVQYILFSVLNSETYSWCLCGAWSVLRLTETQILSFGSPS